MIWQQIYNPAGNMVVSTALAAIPVIIMLLLAGLLVLLGGTKAAPFIYTLF